MSDPPPRISPIPLSVSEALSSMATELAKVVQSLQTFKDEVAERARFTDALLIGRFNELDLKVETNAELIRNLNTVTTGIRGLAESTYEMVTETRRVKLQDARTLLEEHRTSGPR